jgi:hypothetical protein
MPPTVSGAIFCPSLPYADDVPVPSTRRPARIVPTLRTPTTVSTAAATPVAATTLAPDGHRRNVDIAAPTRLGSRVQRIEQAKMAPVPQRVQIGPTCGLYALGMVMDAWHGRDANNATALVQPQDRQGRGKQFTMEPTDPRLLLQVARDAGFTALGEMFTASQLATVATTFGYEAVTHSNATLERLYRVLDAGHPAIVGFDVDRNGDPTDAGGDHAHYAVIQGYFDDGGQRYLVARHGWGVQTDHVWNARDFDASWRALRSTGFYGDPGDGIIPRHASLGMTSRMAEPAALDLPSAGPGRADISSSLARSIVEVFPRTDQAAAQP